MIVAVTEFCTPSGIDEFFVFFRACFLCCVLTKCDEPGTENEITQGDLGRFGSPREARNQSTRVPTSHARVARRDRCSI